MAQIPTPSPSSVFIRENAIIFNIEALRMIITKDEVGARQLPISATDAHIHQGTCCHIDPELSAGALSASGEDSAPLGSLFMLLLACTSKTSLCSPDMTQVAAQVVLLSSPIPGQPLTSSSNPSVDDEFVGELKSILSMAGSSAQRLSRVERALPYELRAVEVGLATAVRAWEIEAIALEHRTRPTLRALLQKVCKLPR